MSILNLDSPRQLQAQRVGLGILGSIIFALYFIPTYSGVKEPKLVVGLWFLFLMTRVGRWSIQSVIYGALLAVLVLFAYSSAVSGGVNSPSMMGMILMPVLMLTALGSAKGWTWLGLSWVFGIALFVGGQLGWLNPTVVQTGHATWSIALIVIAALLGQQFVVYGYGRANERHMKNLEAHSDDLKQAQKALLQAQSHKDEFIASMGHELRTPMNAILGLNGVLQEELKDRAEDLQLAELIRGSTEQLLGLVNNILLLSQLEAGRVVLHAQPVALRALLQRQQSKWSEVVRAKASRVDSDSRVERGSRVSKAGLGGVGLTLEVHCAEEVPQWVQLDEERFEQVLNQLLDNAIKFTQQGHVLLEVSVRSGRLRVDVQDTGPGIAKDKLETIFDRFEQADVNTNRAYGGTGIGLAIAKRLVELHRGQLQVESELGRGAHFWFETDVERAQEPEGWQEGGEGGAGGVGGAGGTGEGLRFLVVDDSPVNLKLTQKMLLQVWPQARVATVTGGEVALAWLEQHEADVVLLDRFMPGMDGLETVRRIRGSEREGVSGVAVLGLTATDDDQEKRRCLAAGMDAVASKPIAPEALKERVLKVRLQQAQQQSRHHKRRFSQDANEWGAAATQAAPAHAAGGAVAAALGEVSSPFTQLKNRIAQLFEDKQRAYAVIANLVAQAATYPILLTTPSELHRWACVVFVTLFSGLLIWFLRTNDLRRTSTYGIFLGMLYVFFLVWIKGALGFSTMSWYLVLTMAVHHLFGVRQGLWATLTVVVMVLVLLLTSVMGWYPDTAAAMHDYHRRMTSSLIDFFLVSFLVFWIPWVYEKGIQKQFEAIKQQQKELEDKQQELEHTVALRDQFIASVSHELRTPMNAILGLNQVLLERVKGRPEAQRVLKYTQQSADHLMTVINDVLDYSQFSSGELNAYKEKFYLREVVQAAYELFVPRAQSVGLDYRCEVGEDVPNWVVSDRHRLMQILVNLLGNAMKFTERGEVVLEVRRGVKSAVKSGNPFEGVEFAVKDTGIGIASENLEKIFERFTQGDEQTQSRFGGTGLGLTISRKLVAILGGELRVSSRLGEGSRFWFVLPLVEEGLGERDVGGDTGGRVGSAATAATTATAGPAQVGAAESAVPAEQAVPAVPVVPAEPRTPETPAAQGGVVQYANRYLLVDDQAINRKLVKLILNQNCKGCTIVEAVDGEDALEKASQEAFDLVIMDMVMPVMDGIEATRRLRASEQERVRRLPVLGLTANVTQSDLERFKQAGANEIMLKPLQVDRLMQSIQRLLSA